MIVGCNSYSLSRLPRYEAFAQMRALGLRDVELWTGHASYLRDEVDPASVASEARVSGLVIHSYGIGGLCGLPLGLVESRLDRAFRFTRGLGIDLVTGIVDRDAVVVADELCNRHGVRFAIENHWYAEIARPEDCAAAVTSASPAIGINIDTGHLAFLGCDLADAARMLGARTLNVHLKAVRAPGRLEVFRRRFQKRYRMEPALPRPGDGLDVFVGTLADAGYRGLLAIEHEAPRVEAELPIYRDRARQLVDRVANRYEHRMQAHG
jgi:sugar phosphate isomerase/epimerase